MGAARLTGSGVGCWLLKTSGPVVLAGARCLRPSYRLGLMRPGDPVVLWVSGRAAPGVHAYGALAGAPYADRGGPGAQWRVEVTLGPLSAPVPRAAFLADPRLAGAEVIRMPAGSNPSYLSPAQWQVLEGLLHGTDRP